MTCLELSREFLLNADSKKRGESVCRDDKKSSALFLPLQGYGNSTARKRLFHRKLGKAVKRVRI